MEYTVVLGIDKKTIEYLKLVWPTWVKHKPSLLERPFVIFHNGVDAGDINQVLLLDGYPRRCLYVDWPPEGVFYDRDGLTKWTNPQRAKMLAGFVHVPASCVETPYWLKLDVDAVAIGQSHWVDPVWFDGNPSIIAPNWSYTKPKDQISRLNEWAARFSGDLPCFNGTDPIDAPITLDSDIVRYPRICSWCAFFSSEFTRMCSRMAHRTCGYYQLPVDSQDGYMWYVAHRGGFSIRRVNMKRFGWANQSSYSSVEDLAKRSLNGDNIQSNKSE